MVQMQPVATFCIAYKLLLNFIFFKDIYIYENTKKKMFYVAHKPINPKYLLSNHLQENDRIGLYTEVCVFEHGSRFSQIEFTVQLCHVELCDLDTSVTQNND